MIGPDERALRASFEENRIPSGGFSHRDHVRLAWTYLKELEFVDAAARVTRGLEAFTQAVGHPEKYHVTITWAFLVLVQERMAALPEDHRWCTFEEEHSDLLLRGRELLLRYYDPVTLASPRARRTFVLPDRAVFSADRACS